MARAHRTLARDGTVAALPRGDLAHGGRAVLDGAGDGEGDGSKSLLDDRRVDHLGAEGDGAEAAGFGVAGGAHDGDGAFRLGFGGAHLAVHDGNLAGVDAADTVEAEPALSPNVVCKTVLVLDVGGGS